MRTPYLTFKTFLFAFAMTLHAVEPPKGEPTNASEAAAQEAAAKKAQADAATNAKYQAIVSTLSAEQQKWERTLQENLGGFYLPLYKRLRVEGRSSCWEFVQDIPTLPRVLLIGDSVSGGYTLSARKALEGTAHVHKAPENCGPTANGLKKLDVWLSPGGQSAPLVDGINGLKVHHFWDAKTVPSNRLRVARMGHVQCPEGEQSRNNSQFTSEGMVRTPHRARTWGQPAHCSQV